MKQLSVVASRESMRKVLERAEELGFLTGHMWWAHDEEDAKNRHLAQKPYFQHVIDWMERDERVVGRFYFDSKKDGPAYLKLKPYDNDMMPFLVTECTVDLPEGSWEEYTTGLPNRSPEGTGLQAIRIRYR